MARSAGMLSLAPQAKPYRGIGMKGFLASWYANLTGRDLQEFRRCARMIADRIKPGARVLELAPGPGYLSIELAKLGGYQVTGLDISASFVRIAADNAKKAGVDVEFRQGDAQAIPYSAGTFDCLVCRAAFKNFSHPSTALAEMHRVLVPGGQALIIDMRSDVSNEVIDNYVKTMKTNWPNRIITGWTFKHILRKRAYSPGEIADMVDQIGFEKRDISENELGMEIWLQK